MKARILKTKHETAEFVAADVFLAGGGFLLGSDLLDLYGSILGAPLVVLGLFLGLRLLWTFSSDLKDLKVQIGRDRNNLERTKRKVERTRREVQETLAKLKQTEERLFGVGGSTFAKSNWARPLEGDGDELKQKIGRLEEKVKEMYQEHERRRRGF